MGGPKVVWSFKSEHAIRALATRRQFLDALREAMGTALDEPAAAIIFTELVGNVAMHAPGPVSLLLEVEGQNATLTVVDSGPGFEFNPSLPRSPFSESGRGLFLVSHYARTIRVERRDGSGANVKVGLPLKGR